MVPLPRRPEPGGKVIKVENTSSSLAAIGTPGQSAFGGALGKTERKLKRRLASSSLAQLTKCNCVPLMPAAATVISVMTNGS